MKRTTKHRVNNVLDVLHKGFVWTCIGITLYGTAYLGYRFVHYAFVSLPEFKEKKRLEEQHLLAEGSSENLRDIAPSIS